MSKAFYVTFPVALLARPREDRDLGVDWAIRAFGQKRYQGLDEGDWARAQAEAEVLFPEHHLAMPAHLPEAQFYLGAKDLGVTLGGPACLRLARLHEFDEWLAGRSKTSVRVRGDLFFDWCRGRMPHQKFAVMTAIYCRIGPKPFAKISNADIVRLAAGLCSRAEAEAAERGELDAGGLLTADKVRSEIGRLRADSLITKYTYNRGECFFSHVTRHPTSEDLGIAVLRSKARRRGLGRDVAKNMRFKELEYYIAGRKDGTLKENGEALDGTNAYLGAPKGATTLSQGEPKVTPTYIETPVGKPQENPHNNPPKSESVTTKKEGKAESPSSKQCDGRQGVTTPLLEEVVALAIEITGDRVSATWAESRAVSFFYCWTERNWMTKAGHDLRVRDKWKHRLTGNIEDDIRNGVISRASALRKGRKEVIL